MHTLYTTMLINLAKSQDELWEQIGNLRTDVRKAQKNGVSVVTDPTPGQIAEAYALYAAMMRKRFLPVERSYALPTDPAKGKVIAAVADGKVVSYISFSYGSKVDLLGKARICAFETIATADEAKPLAPNPLLYWEGILHMKSLGFEYLNFNGVSYQYGGAEFDSLARFKRKWNGLEIECVSRKSVAGYVYWRFLRRIPGVRRAAYEVLTRCFPKKFLR